jgi:hypothetical protein
MGQLILMVVVPPIVGLVAYAVVRLLRERDKETENGVTDQRRRDA